MRLLAALAAALVACAVDPAVGPRDCTPGQTVACACPGASGVQTCGDDGRLGACVCADAASPADAVDVVTAPDRPVVVDVLAADVVDASAPDVPAVEDRPAPVDAPDVVMCDPRQTCGADCVADFLTDPRHCGACNVRCEARGAGSVPSCVGGRCTLGCTAGFVPCGTTACVNPSTPSFDCAACGFSCPSGQRCDFDGARGRCVAR